VFRIRTLIIIAKPPGNVKGVFEIFLFFCLQLNFAVFGLVGLHGVPDQNENLTVGGAAFIVGYDMKFVEGSLVNTDG
jgi:hypothetical protein